MAKTKLDNNCIILLLIYRINCELYDFTLFRATAAAPYDSFEGQAVHSRCVGYTAEGSS